MNQYKIVYKFFACKKIGHLTKNCELQSTLYPKFTSANCSGNCPKTNVLIVEAIIALLTRDALLINLQ